MQRYFDLLTQLWPLHRTLVSDDMDKALGLISSFLHDTLELPAEYVLLHEFPSGSSLSTWLVPQKYSLKDYRLTQIGGHERTIIDSSQISLSIAEYSESIDRILDYDEIQSQLFYSERRPDAIPFVFKYFYRKNFGFCLPKTVFEGIDHKRKFHAYIDSEFTDGTLKCLEVVIPGATDDSILIMSNICHPHQVNDAISGAINALMLIEYFIKHPPYHTLRFGFWPETIGAMAYFTQYRERVSMFKYAIFTEMLGTSGRHALQWSRQENTLVDRAAEYQLDMHGADYYSGRYTTVVRNDERISNGVNLNIPTISLSRYPYTEYHTSDDNPSIINMNNVKQSSEITCDIIKTLDENLILVPVEEVYGQPFLTRYGLFHDPVTAGGDAHQNYNKIMEDIFSYSDGTLSLLEIANRFKYPWDDVGHLAQGLIDNHLYSGHRLCYEVDGEGASRTPRPR